MGSMSKTLGALALASAALFAGDAPAGTHRPDPRQQDAAHRLRSRCAALLLHRSRQPGERRSRRAIRSSSAAPCSTTAQEQLKIPDLKIAYVAVNSQNRFDAITGNKADLLCESSTATLSRRGNRRFLDPDLHRWRQLRDRVPTARATSSCSPARRSACCPAPRPSRSCAARSPARRSMPRSCWSRPTRRASSWSRTGGVAAYFADRATLTFLLREGEAGGRPADGRNLSQHRADRAGDAARRPRFPPRRRYGAEPHLPTGRDHGRFSRRPSAPLTTPSPLLAALYQISGLPD